jgi:hypothetical protein
MYSRIFTNAAQNWLSVNALVQCPSGCSQVVHNWKISPDLVNGPIGFVAKPPSIFTGWPSSPSSPIYQLAPTPGLGAYLFMAALYNNSIYKAVATGGPVGAPWNTAYEKDPLGLATVPTGQY